MTATVVTAYYQLKHRYSMRSPCSAVAYDPKNPYIAWIKNLFKLQANIIIFTDVGTYEGVLKPITDATEKKNISVQILERTEFYATSRLGINWKQQYCLDREREVHTPDVYDVWTQKVDFVRRALDVAEFKSDWYAWVDVGCFRGFYDYDYVFLTFPSTRRMVPSKINVNLITQLRPEEIALRRYHTEGGFVPNLRRDVVAATCLAGDRTAWAQFHTVYYDTVKRYHDQGFFVGREETIYTKCLIIYPELFHTYRNISSSIKEVFKDIYNISHWHYFKLYLSDDASAGTDDTPLLVTA